MPIYLDSDTVGQVEGQAVRFVPVPSAEAKAALQGTMPACCRASTCQCSARQLTAARASHPRGVIVYLPATWTQPQVQACDRTGPAASQVFDATRNGLLVQSAPGLPSPDLANRLLKLPDGQTAVSPVVSRDDRPLVPSLSRLLAPLPCRPSTSRRTQRAGARQRRSVRAGAMDGTFKTTSNLDGPTPSRVSAPVAHMT